MKMSKRKPQVVIFEISTGKKWYASDYGMYLDQYKPVQFFQHEGFLFENNLN